MKRVVLMGLSVLAAIAFSVIAASPAFADEYGVCAKAAKITVEWKEGGGTEKKTVYSGEYLNKNCTEAASDGEYREKGGSPGPEGKYEWDPYPGPAGTNWEYTSKGKAAKLKTAVGEVKCLKSHGAGTVGTDQLVLEDCTNSVYHTACYSVDSTKTDAKGGTIETFSDASMQFGAGENSTGGGEPAEGEDWDQLAGNETVDGIEHVLMSFDCVTPLGEDPFIITGSVSGVQTGDVNVTSNKAMDSFGSGKGEQDLTAITASPEGEHELKPYTVELEADESVKEDAKTVVKTPKIGISSPGNTGGPQPDWTPFPPTCHFYNEGENKPGPVCIIKYTYEGGGGLTTAEVTGPTITGKSAGKFVELLGSEQHPCSGPWILRPPNGWCDIIIEYKGPKPKVVNEFAATLTVTTEWGLKPPATVQKRGVLLTAW